MKAADIYKAFGASSSTGQSKSKVVRDTLDMYQMDPNWSLPSLIDQNPLVWMISVNGFMMDVRSAPRQVQEIAYAKGLIPYIPGTDPSENSTPTPKTTVPHQRTKTPTSPNALFVLMAFIIDGPITEAFAVKNPEISRKIEIKASSTLQDLHKILFKAFNRQEEHLYEFQIGGQGPNDPNAERYGLNAGSAMSLFGDELAGDVTTTTLASLGLSVGESFGYWFDFGDDWWHQIDILAIVENAPKGKYPRIAERVGASPPQYADFD